MKLFGMFTILFIFFWLVLAVSYIVNIVQLCKCDFEPSYKAETVHGIGIVFPPASLVTVWVSVGK
jgi:hypothetical protein